MSKTIEEERYEVLEQVKKSLKSFQFEFDVFSKGKLSLIIQLTRMARNKEFPLQVSNFQTNSKGQVKGIGGGNLKRILADHGITQQLTAEGGRTSRGSMDLMIAYVKFLNTLYEKTELNLKDIEDFWAEEVQLFFHDQHFIVSVDSTKTIYSIFDDLFEQAKKREKQNKGTKYLGIMLQ